MQTYLQPDTLAAARITAFDAWAATFGRTVTTLELAPDGGSYRPQSRFARFANVPELVVMFRAVADVRTVDQQRLAMPAIAAGRAEIVVVPASEGLERLTRTSPNRPNAAEPNWPPTCPSASPVTVTPAGYPSRTACRPSGRRRKDR